MAEDDVVVAKETSSPALGPRPPSTTLHYAMHTGHGDDQFTRFRASECERVAQSPLRAWERPHSKVSLHIRGLGGEGRIGEEEEEGPRRHPRLQKQGVKYRRAVPTDITSLSYRQQLRRNTEEGTAGVSPGTATALLDRNRTDPMTRVLNTQIASFAAKALERKRSARVVTTLVAGSSRIKCNVVARSL